jgi:hypothetical protein
MKIINFIGILLILLTSTIGNKIAPGRYCAYSKNDTVWAFGPTRDAENDKYGFWVLLDQLIGKKDINLYAVGKFENNRLNGTWIEFQVDSLQTRAIESYYENDTLNGHFYDYDTLGKLCASRIYEKNHCISGVIYPNGKYLFSGSDGDDYPNLDVFSTTLMITSDPHYYYNKFVIFNSWTNKITTIIIVICCILIILNFYNYVRHKN